MIPISRPSIGEEELSKVAEVFKTGWLGMGAVTFEFEEKIKTFLGSKNVIATNTGTSSIHVALDAHALKWDDEVIVPSGSGVGIPSTVNVSFISLSAFSLLGRKSTQSLRATMSPVVGLVKSGITP